MYYNISPGQMMAPLDIKPHHKTNNWKNKELIFSKTYEATQQNKPKKHYYTEEFSI